MKEKKFFTTRTENVGGSTLGYTRRRRDRLYKKKSQKGLEGVGGTSLREGGGSSAWVIPWR